MQTRLNGINVNVLKRSKEYCEYLYGKDYLIPNKDWNSWTDPFNIVFEDEIISKNYIRNVPELSAYNYSNTLAIYLKSIYELVGHRRVYCSSPYFSLHNGTPGLILFLYVYARYLKDTTSNNLANHLLSNLNEFPIFPTPKNYADGPIGYYFFLDHLFGNEYLEIDHQDLFCDIDELAVQFICEYNDAEAETIIELIGCYTYVFNRMKNISDRTLKSKALEHLIFHLLFLYQFILQNIDDLEKDKLTSEKYLILSKAIIFISRTKKLRVQLQRGTYFSEMLKEHDFKLEKSIKNHLINHRDISYIFLYASLQYLNESGLHFLKETFDKLSFQKQPYKDDTCFFIHNMQSYIRLLQFFNGDGIYNSLLHDEINKFFFKNGIFNLLPYKSLAGI